MLLIIIFIFLDSQIVYPLPSTFSVLHLQFVVIVSLLWCLGLNFLLSVLKRCTLVSTFLAHHQLVFTRNAVPNSLASSWLLHMPYVMLMNIFLTSISKFNNLLNLSWVFQFNVGCFRFESLHLVLMPGLASAALFLLVGPTV